MRYKMLIAEGTTTFLFEFSQAHKKLLQQLHDVEDNLYDLRDRCIAERLFAESEQVYVPHNAFVEEINESVNDGRDRSPLWTAVLHRNVAAHLQNANFADKKDFVNSWILDWIQDSSLDALRLRDIIYSQYPQQGKQLQGEEWSELALQFWDEDEAGRFANQKDVLRTIDALLGGTGWSDSLDEAESLAVGLEDGEVVDTYIMGSEPPVSVSKIVDCVGQKEDVFSDLDQLIHMRPSLPQQGRPRRSSL
ncbi:hypothetical protein F5882DRAFT_25311 [Hyaloscypha sp. PMI_1271]|nr:hypothetical protein F5882DRAFT_25311 [Hyaloscypha sp. PMI_1271]